MKLIVLYIFVTLFPIHDSIKKKADIPWSGTFLLFLIILVIEFCMLIIKGNNKVMESV